MKNNKECSEIINPLSETKKMTSPQTLSSTHYKWFEYAGVIAMESNLLFKLGCVATYGGKMIACGCNNHNNYSKHDKMCEFSCSCHAEINVIRKCLKLIGEDKMKRVNLYVARMDNKNNYQNSAPCYDCTREIKRLKIKNIIFKDDISIRIMSPVNYNNEHRTFGYYFLKRTMSKQSIEYRRKFNKRTCGSNCKCNKKIEQNIDDYYFK